MKISTEIDSIAAVVGEEKAVEYVAKAGFDAWDFSMFKMFDFDWGNRVIRQSSHPLGGDGYLEFARKLRRIGEEYGIVCNQSHAPFPTEWPQAKPYLLRAIECTAEAGGKICIIHPINNETPEKNAEMYRELLPFAKQCGVKIATENMWNWYGDYAAPAACSDVARSLAVLDAVGDENLVYCLDIGHAEMKGLDTSAVEMVRGLGHHLQALHIHDNDKIHDLHEIPFSDQIDFPPIAAALRETGYAGYFTLEAPAYLSGCPAGEAEEKVKDLAQAARRFAGMYEGK